MNAATQPLCDSTPHHLIPHDFGHFTLHALLDEARLLMGQERALQYRLAAVLRELDACARRAHWVHCRRSTPRFATVNLAIPKFVR